MTTTILNLTLPVVTEEIEAVLDTYPYHPYQQAFSIPDLRQKLIAYILNRIPGNYRVVEEREKATGCIEAMNCTSAERSLIQALVHQGIQEVLEDNADWASHRIPQPTRSAFAPSSWFG